MLLARTAGCRVTDSYLTRLKLIWSKSSQKNAKMSRKRVFCKKLRGSMGQATKTVLKESQRSRIQFSYISPYVHIALMVVSQKGDSGFITYFKNPSVKVMFYYQPLICGQFLSLYCSTLPTEYFIAHKLTATFMAELTL